MPIYALDGVKPQYQEEGSNWIAPDAVLVGDVRLGRNVGIWFGCMLRGDNEPIIIGEDTNVQELTVMHTDRRGAPLVVGRLCTIGHRAIVHGCTIGDNTLIGMGAMVMNRARIGANSIVGAGSIVTEDKEFPDNSLIIGAPGRLVRTLDDAAVARMKDQALRYVENGRRFMKGMTQL